MTTERKVKLLMAWPWFHILLFILLAIAVGRTGRFYDGLDVPVYSTKIENGRYYFKTDKSKPVWIELKRWQYDRRLQSDNVGIAFVAVGLGSLLLYQYFAMAWIRRNGPEFLYKETQDIDNRAEA